MNWEPATATGRTSRSGTSSGASGCPDRDGLATSHEENGRGDPDRYQVNPETAGARAAKLG